MTWRYRGDVALEVEEIAWDYEQARDGLGQAFLDELERLYEQLETFPLSRPEVRARHQGPLVEGL